MPPVSKCLWQFAGRISDDLFPLPVVKRRKIKNKKREQKIKAAIALDIAKPSQVTPV